MAEYKNLIKVGITGSYGKTSVKELCNAILSERYNVLSTPKSFNTPMGISTTINNSLSESTEIFIIEMGAKKRGEIKYLSKFVSPNIGVVTAVGRQHTNTFKGIDGVYSTKKELPDFLKGQTCVFNLMNEYTLRMYRDYSGNAIGVYLVIKKDIMNCKHLLKTKNIVRFLKRYQNVSYRYFEFPKNNTVYAKNIVLSENGSLFDVFYNGKFLIRAKIFLLGLHNVLNSLMAVAIAKFFGVTDSVILCGLSKVSSISARIEKSILPSGAVVLNNGYNSNIDSAKSSLAVLDLFSQPKKIVVTPGLVETENDVEYNEKFGELVAKCCTDVYIVKKKNRDYIYAGLKASGFDMSRVLSFSSFQEVKPYLNSAKSDTVFLIENDLPDNFS
ncbi:MAG: UDP-N-acetylmuramoyl-tripeptide--D-alanyl-D-alanine ligase [Clostridia bacterium]|nr:UDP-N-acetylmuramoyl-tripeptide--D-alanyl-D-alanine ligase [Clostridia bacterium]